MPQLTDESPDTPIALPEAPDGLPDITSVDQWNDRVETDGGPYYTETVDLSASIVEPYNTVTAGLFIVIVIVWIVRLWGRFGRYPFLTCCLPILLAGGVGGTLYHATRSSRFYFLMDVIPITLLAVAATVYLWIRLKPKLWQVILLIVGFTAIRGAGFFVGIPRAWAINISYGLLALLVLIPIVLVLIRTRFRDVGWVGTALGCFAIAWVCRILDPVRPPVLPMGTHWLWHTFGAAATAALSEYIYRIEGRAELVQSDRGVL